MAATTGTQLAGLEPAASVLLRVFFLAASFLVLLLQAVPALRSRFLAYGSRATPAKDQRPARPQDHSATSQLLDYAASIQVPHSYFTQFYVVSVFCSLFWGYSLQLWSASPRLQIVWSLMLLQGVRRLLESHAYTSSSKSTMWFAHWLLGLVFYLSINVAVWIETPATAPGDVGWKTAILVPAILTAHMGQHTYHAYLYHLRSENKGYQLPSHPLFPSLLCPHYTCEVVIYALLSFLAAPEGRWVNWTLFCGTIFVATNLGVTAIGTKAWYMDKFGVEQVGPRRRMVPWVW